MKVRVCLETSADGRCRNLLLWLAPRSKKWAFCLAFGPPVWWLPKVGKAGKVLGYTRYRVGWLLVGVNLFLQSNRFDPDKLCAAEKG